MVVRAQRAATWWGVVGIIGGILAICADVLSVFSAQPDPSYVALSVTISDLTGLMLQKSHAQLVAGHYLSFVAVPLECAGVIIHAYFSFTRRHAAYARVFLMCGAALAVWGTAYHATYGLVVEIVQNANPALIERAASYYEPLGMGLTIALMTYFGYFALLVLTRRTVYRRWTAAVSPIAIMLAVFGLVAIMPDSLRAARAFLTVTGMNLPLVAWLVAALIIRPSTPRSVIPRATSRA